MRTLFEILSSKPDTENCKLICEVSNEGFSFFIRNEDSNFFLGFGVYHYDKNKPAVGLPIDLKVLFHQKEIFSQSFKDVCVIYSFPESALVPSVLYQKEKESSLMKMMFGDVNAEDGRHTDIINPGLLNCYRIPVPVSEVINEHFPQAKIKHQYSIILEQSKCEDNQICLIFYTQKMVVYVRKEGKIQFINSFDFQEPEDASYHILNVSKQLNIENPRLLVHGLIEEKSPLFTDLYKYFEEIKFAELPDNNFYTEDITQFPAHYFSHIFAVNSCG